MKTFWKAQKSRSEGRNESGYWHLPFFFSITPVGWGFILGVFLLLVASLHSGNNLLILVLAVLLSTILTSGLFARNSLRSALVTLQIPENVFENEQVSVRVSVRNRKWFLPTLSITVEDLAAGRKRSLLRGLTDFGRKKDIGAAVEAIDRSVLRHPAYFPWIPPRSVRSELVSQKYPRRGLYELMGFRILTRFPFGLFVRGERIAAEGKVWVYPPIHEVSSYFHLLPFPSGRVESARVGPGESLFAIRPYRDGESARLVNWKATAKTGRLMAREFARDEENTFCLILDTTVCPEEGTGAADFEGAVSLAASFAWHFEAEGAEYEFLSPRQWIPAGIGSAHLYRVLRALAVVDSERGPSKAPEDLRDRLAGILGAGELERVLSDKVLKIVITSRARSRLPASDWHAAHVLAFQDL